MEQQKTGETEKSVRRQTKNLPLKVSLTRSLAVLGLHGVDGAHAAVLLHADAIGEVVLAGRLGGARQHAAHHGGTGAQRQCLQNVPHRADAAVGQRGHAELARVVGDLVDGSRLGPTAGHHLLGDANRAGAHAHAKCVGAGVDQVLRLRLSDHYSLVF